MSSQQIRPFFVPDDGDIAWGNWSLEKDRPKDITGLFENWPPKRSTRLWFSANLNESFYTHVHNGNPSDFSLVLEIFCPSTRTRTIERVNPSRKNPANFSGSIFLPVDRVAGSIELTATIVGPGIVSDDGDASDIPAARLASVTRRFSLDPDSELLPTREVDFDDHVAYAGLEVPWVIHTSFRRLEDKFQYHLTPLINKKNKKLIASLGGSDSNLMWQLVCDIIRTAIRVTSSLVGDDLSVAQDEIEELTHDYPESLIACVDGYARDMRLENAIDLLQLYRDRNAQEELELKIKKLGWKHV